MIICKKEIELLGMKYLVYLKKVPTKLPSKENIEGMTFKAYVKTLEEDSL